MLRGLVSPLQVLDSLQSKAWARSMNPNLDPNTARCVVAFWAPMPGPTVFVSTAGLSLACSCQEDGLVHIRSHRQHPFSGDSLLRRANVVPFWICPRLGIVNITLKGLHSSTLNHVFVVSIHCSLKRTY